MWKEEKLLKSLLRGGVPPGVCSGDREGAENPELIVSDLSCKKWALAVGGTPWRGLAGEAGMQGAS